MNPIRFVLAAAVAAFALGGCGPSAEKAPGAADPFAEITPSADYPLKVCVVSGEPLDGMEGRTAVRHEGVEVQFCCAECIAEFRKDPAKYVAQVKAGAK